MLFSTSSSNFTTESPADFNTTDWTTTVYDNMCTNISVCNGTSNATNITGNDTGLVDGGTELPHSLWLTIFLGTAAGIVIIVTVLGNILVLLAFILERSIRQPTNYFIASLAMSDILIGTFSMPCFTLYLLLGRWPLGEIICDLWLSLDWTVCLASQYTVFFITADRFCSVKIPAKYRNWRTERKVKVMIALSWIIPTLVFFTSIIGWQYFVGVRTVAAGNCEVQFMSDPLFTFLLTIGYYWTTLAVMIGLYGGIYRVALMLQHRANEKHKKLKYAMQLGKDKKASKSAGAGKVKEGKKRAENNNARYLRGVTENNTLTTSFSKNSDAEYSKPSEEDRSSSPAFASDEEEGSSDQRKEGCYVNSAVQTEPTLKGMLGTSFNHMSRLAFSISGTSVSASQASGSSDRETSDDHHNPEYDQQKPLINESKQVFKSISSTPPPCYNDAITSNASTEEKTELPPASPLLENDILDGLRYIDEESLKSLQSAENVRLLAELNEKNATAPANQEADSPVWRKRVTDDDNSLQVPVSGDSASSDSHSNVTMVTRVPERQASNNSAHRKRNEGSRHHSRHRTDSTGSKRRQRSPNHTDTKSKDQKSYGSPLQTLVKTLRPTLNKDKKGKPVKSKSENRARKALRTISIILGAYVLCWTPYHIMVFIIGVCGDWSCINLKLYYFTYWLCYLNSPINPFCYAFANAQFKRTFIRILKMDFHRT